MPVFLAAPARGLKAQDVPRAECARRGAIVAHLAEKYGEAPIAADLASTGAVIEVLARPDGGSWTIIVTSPRGVACLAAHGEAWRQLRSPLEPALPGEF